MNRFLKLALPLMALITLMPVSSVWAEAAHDHDHAAIAPAGGSVAEDRYTHGEIRKVDAAQGKLTIRHGDIKNLGMPGMTMIFKVANPQLLNVKAGDKVKFVAEMVNGVLMVTSLQGEAGN